MSHSVGRGTATYYSISSDKKKKEEYNLFDHDSQIISLIIL